MLALIVSLVEEAIKVTPGLVTDLQAIFSKPNPTPADWLALKTKIQGTTFEQLAPDAPTQEAPPAAT